jgi:hypothetical protein
MADYRKLNRSHRLSGYKARLPLWGGSQAVREPFDGWTKEDKLPWYQAYNRTKHNRHKHFEDANFGALTDAMCALVILHAAQFMQEDFGRHDYLTESAGRNADNFHEAAGGYFLVEHASNWPLPERYDIEWASLDGQADPFQNFDFKAVP